MMRQIIDHQRQLRLAEGSAAGATCQLKRGEYEKLARAYEKIIGVLKRDRLQAAVTATKRK